MKQGSVIVDLAVESGGNCALSEPGKVVHKHGVTIVGHRNVPGRLATDASALYAKNLLNLVTLLINKESKKLEINWEDEIVKGTALTKDGKVIHPAFGGKPVAEAKPEKSPAKGGEPKKDTAKEAAPKPAAKKAPAKKAPVKKKAPAKKTAAKPKTGSKK
jgi:NAD(P) transhydrogenase subunit alpha